MTIANEIIGRKVEVEEELDIDSISFINLVIMFECEFDIEFGKDDLLPSNFPTLRNFIMYIKNKLNIVEQNLVIKGENDGA